MLLIALKKYFKIDDQYKYLFDFSNYPKDSKVFDQANKKLLAK